MKLEKKVKGVKGAVCALLLGLNVANSLPLSANPANPTPPKYNFSEFFEFQQQKTLEDLINYTLQKYLPLINEAKSSTKPCASCPDYTFQELIDNSSFVDKLRFGWLTFWDYSRNLGKLGYSLDGIVFIDGDFLRFSVYDKKGDILKVSINANSKPKSIDIEGIKNFLAYNEPSLAEFDENSHLVYRINRHEK